MDAKSKIRLDNLLVERGFYNSRSRARDAVARGCVFVAGKPALKSGRTLAFDSVVEINDPAKAYVSRSALKLIEGLAKSGFDPAGRVALDVGASTGGFTQVLLERGAKQVFAVDVGHGQMDADLVCDPRVTNLENLNARELSIDDLGGVVPEFLVCDVSFISLKLALPPALDIAASGAHGIFLVKPQFELGRDHIGRGGLVRDKDAAKECAQALSDWLDKYPQWQCTHFLPSPIFGGDGNEEYLMAGTKQ
ncbi:MAG: TlyA family RNA methyltransferase [Rhizobiaceae bacterium]|nr:TlyA family RNA methyltransferase [Rhizobiaceae bacterium]